MTATTTEEFLSERLMTPAGQPLRVAVYSRLADGIRSGVFPLGAMLPRETELAEQLGISRTPVREALMLLEEDGLIRTRRGVGRFVADAIPRSGLELFQPFDVALSESGAPVEVEVLEFEIQQTTDFVSTKLALDSAANTWFRESLLRRDGEPIAILQEHLPAGKYLSDVSPAIAAELQEVAALPASLHASLTARRGPQFDSAVCQIAASVAGKTRAKLLGIDPADPVLVLTQVAERSGTPLYLAKCITSSHVGQLTVMQSTASVS